MTCKINILGVIGQKKGGALIAIKVFGSATDCDLLNITITCDGQPRTFSSKVTDGAWSVIAPPGDPREHPCQCNSAIEIAAECASGQCRSDFLGTLVCQDVNSCPDIAANIDTIDADSKCDAGGKRIVTGTVVVSPDPSNAVGVTLTIDGAPFSPPVSHPATTTPYALSFSAQLVPGTHWLKVTPTDPGCGAVSVAINVPKCPGSEACPKVEIRRIEEGECRGGKRVATVSVLITPLGGPTDANLMHGGTTLDSALAQIAPFVLSGADTFSSTDIVVVNITNPIGCPPTSVAIDVAPCPDGPGPGGQPGGEGGGGDDGDGSGCLIGRVFVVLLLVSALFMLLVGVCVPGAAPVAFIAAAALAIAGGIAFGIWWALCGSKCGALLLIWQVAMVGAWVSAYLATCCLPALLIALGLGALSLAFLAAWITTCKPKKCKLFTELLWVYVAAIGTIFAYLTKLAPCGMPTIPIAAASIAAVLTLAVALACKK